MGGPSWHGTSVTALTLDSTQLQIPCLEDQGATPQWPSKPSRGEARVHPLDPQTAHFRLTHSLPLVPGMSLHLRPLQTPEHQQKLFRENMAG